MAYGVVIQSVQAGDAQVRAAELMRSIAQTLALSDSNTFETKIGIEI